MQKIKVCIVEDESIEALDIKRILEKSRYTVTGIFATGEQFLASENISQNDVILMDIRLGGRLDGIETAQKFHRECSIPVIFLTAYSDRQTVKDFYRSNPYGYLIKPVDQRELTAAIDIAHMRYQSSRSIEQSEKKYRSLFENSLTANFIISKDLKIIDFNKAFIHGIESKDELAEVENSICSYIPDISDLLKKVEAGENTGELIEAELKTSSGFDKKILLTISPLATGRDNGYRGVFVDISERFQLQQQLKQSQKMEALGRLAGGIAHDFNNILTVILGYTILIPDKIERGIDLLNDISGIKNAADRAAALTKQLLALSRKQPLKQEQFNPNDALRDMEKMLNRIVPEDKKLDIVIEDSPVQIFADKSQIEMVLLNLVINACDAVEAGGSITVRSGSVELKQTENTLFSDIEPGSYSLLTVSDTGSGIPENIVGKIFDPFFTTKSPDKGTGLGLSTVLGIVKQNDGFIDLKTAPGVGSEFRVFFKPSNGHHAVVKKKYVSHDYSVLKNRKILIVEDDNDIRNLMRSVLENNGATVSSASNPGEAILLIEEKHNNYDLIITDIIMPIMNGFQMVKRIKKLKKSQKALYMSGYDVPPEMLRSKKSGSRIVFKPFLPNQLLDAASAELTGKKIRENISES